MCVNSSIDGGATWTSGIFCLAPRRNKSALNGELGAGTADGTTESGTTVISSCRARASGMSELLSVTNLMRGMVGFFAVGDSYSGANRAWCTRSWASKQAAHSAEMM